jgi:hypothetical protein
MKNLEKYIIDNREAMDTAEPGEGHFVRFAEKLEQKHRKTRIISLPYILKAASVIILVVLSSLWAYENLIKSPAQSKGLSLGDISPEYKEVEIYYTSMVNLKYNEINQMDFLSDTVQKKILFRELAEMDLMYNNLKEELKYNPNDERIINAMIEHYQLKLEVMNHILRQLNQIQDETLKNQINNESTKI